MDKLEELRAAYARDAIILFVGAGVSRSIGLPSWSALIEHMASELGLEADAYSGNGDWLTLAEYYRLQHGGIGALRDWMELAWQHCDIGVAESRTHELIAKARFPIVYTTNYDRWLEAAFEHHGTPYVKIVNVADLTHRRHDATQIVKFHGDFEDEESIVLDESSYFRRLDFESPLDIKLRADVLGRSVLFVGYSLADINVRYLFYKLSRMWKSAVPTVPQPRSYVFSPVRDPVQQAVLAQWGLDMIALEREDPTQALIEFLEAVVS